MSSISAELYKSIQDNDLDKVIFSDPFGVVARQAKRSLLISSFVALLIAVLGLEITGFLGLKTTVESFGNEIAQGLACLLVLYFFVTFLFHTHIDYSAWTFMRERQQTQPYLELIKLLESRASVTAEQIKNACSGIKSMDLKENNIRYQSETRQLIQNALGQLQSIDKKFAELLEEARPLFISWEATIHGMGRLSLRLRARFVSLWTLDILMPLLLGIAAIYRTHGGLAVVVEKIAS